MSKNRRAATTISTGLLTKLLFAIAAIFAIFMPMTEGITIKGKSCQVAPHSELVNGESVNEKI
jgi:hypothetical protein